MKRISFHRKLQLLWLIAHGFLLWALLSRPSWILLSLALVWTVIVNIGSEAGAHRYFAHRAYATKNRIKNLLIFLQTFAGEGSVVAFCGVHRQHHALADRENDPHSPQMKSPLSITYWLETVTVNPRYIADCLRDRWVKFQHVNYFAFHLALLALVLIIFGPVTYGYFFALPIVLILYGNAATNILGHQPHRGYRNFETDDRSVNIGGAVNFLLMGGGLQNNHHAFPSRHTNRAKAGECDSMGWIIEKFLMTKPVSSYTCHTYIPGDSRSEELLESYFRETTVKNNRTRKSLRVDRYDGTSGALFLLLENDRVVGMTSCVRYDEGGIASAKVWHRLHILPHVPHSMIDKYFEPKTFEWCRSGKIERLWVTFNDSTPRIAGWAAARMGERRNAARPNPYSKSYGAEIRSGWRPHHKMIFERGVWQYVIYYSPDGKPFLKREEKELDDEMVQIFKKEFPNATCRWN